MFVLARGLVAAGMATYGAIHLLQMADPPASAPGWLAVAYGLTAVAAIAIAALSIIDDRPRRRYAATGAVIAALSMIALGLSLTTGFFGVETADLRPEALIAVVSELVTIGAWVALTIARRSSEYAAAETNAAEAEPAMSEARGAGYQPAG